MGGGGGQVTFSGGRYTTNTGEEEETDQYIFSFLSRCVAITPSLSKWPLLYISDPLFDMGTSSETDKSSFFLLLLYTRPCSSESISRTCVSDCLPSAIFRFFLRLEFDNRTIQKWFKLVVFFCCLL